MASDPLVTPGFSDRNSVVIKYCDSSSANASVTMVNNTRIHYQGAAMYVFTPGFLSLQIHSFITNALLDCKNTLALHVYPSIANALFFRCKYTPAIFFHLKYTNATTAPHAVPLSPNFTPHFNPLRILSAAFRDLRRFGIGDATDVVVAGCSAGALAVLLNIDRIARLLPASARIRGLSDAGYFIDAVDQSGVEFRRVYTHTHTHARRRG